jgi:gamma-glutamylcyclotransferase (GGCT)/AIG2-like uncharacterized protein YtfP
MYDLGAFPGVKLAVSASSPATVHGELFQVTPEALKQMDRFEGHPTYYKRTKVQVTQATGEQCEAWVYEYQPALRMHEQLVESGVWLEMQHDLHQH